MSKAFVLVAHGSRKDESNHEIIAFTQQLQPALAGHFKTICHAFLELCEPDLHARLEQLITEGVHSVTLFPFFLAAGKHVRHDLPDLVAELKQKYPHCEFVLLEHLGKQSGLVKLIQEAVL
ncbi:sirohydrochlorin chelatase [Celerinatantimonas diazotrophica]|jgi:sirohydrochlorin cobaltochelatase|uniref:CbiX protein n=1 Tax=Celerinatantimonas diazotrophica TaxID=412034 RepID=A0A4R1KGN6_9GAMM|nr:CbiX/SirB N-terminal domain-containing protein [Celerinatantimonas diazotrophica]TCK63203.1 CbiX protein [Celerinatantimonas diazotrophica]CAG9295572.1 Sirohydrochlorin cobaltochelatase [Celerinatantimonas diazotrophica]